MRGTLSLVGRDPFVYMPGRNEDLLLHTLYSLEVNSFE